MRSTAVAAPVPGVVVSLSDGGFDALQLGMTAASLRAVAAPPVIRAVRSAQVGSPDLREPPTRTGAPNTTYGWGASRKSSARWEQWVFAFAVHTVRLEKECRR